MSETIKSMERDLVDQQIFQTFKMIYEDQKLIGGEYLTSLLWNDKKGFSELFSNVDEFKNYVISEYNSFGSNGVYKDRQKAIKTWNLMEGYYPPRTGGLIPTTYFANLKAKSAKKTGKGIINVVSNIGKKYKEAFY